MDAVQWLGIIILGAILLDVFLTALNYNGAGFLTRAVTGAVWRVLRRLTRGMSRGQRPALLRQVTGIQIVVMVGMWLGGAILGYAFIYLGMMDGRGFVYDGATDGLFAAIYFSTAQLGTVGTSQVVPNTDVSRIISVLESLTGVVLVALILTFLLGVYGVISALRRLSAQFYNPRDSVGDPVASLKPYFPGGEPRDLDSKLSSIADSVSSYADGVRLHPSAYYFQSGRDTVSLPYSIRMLSGVVGALRWGLPTSHPATAEPTLLPLTDRFLEFADHMHPLVGWTSIDVPEMRSRGEFRRLIDADIELHRTPGRRSAPPAESEDPWVACFARVNRNMSELAHLEPFTDLDDAYDRYVDWLPFAYRAQQFTEAVGRDLDYQPVHAPGWADVPENTVPVSDAAAAAPKRTTGGVRAFFANRFTLIDPGHIRLFGALRVIIAAAVSVVVVAIGLEITGKAPMPTAIFGGMITMFAGGVAAQSGARPGFAKFRGMLALLPVVAAVGLITGVPHEPLPSALAVAALAFVGVFLTRFGPEGAGLGRVLFMTFYFSLLLRLSPDDFAAYALTGLVSVTASVLVQFIPMGRGRIGLVRGGVRAFENSVAKSIDPLVDAVSAARWDPDLRKRVHSGLDQLHHTASFLGGQLTEQGPVLHFSAEQLNNLRIRLFDVELATVNLSVAARDATGAGMRLPVRALLAGQLEQLQVHIRSYPDLPRWMDEPGENGRSGEDEGEAFRPLGDVPDPIDWPLSAQRLHRAVRELRFAVEALQTARPEDLVAGPSGAGGPSETDAAVSSPAIGAGPDAGKPESSSAPSGRRRSGGTGAGAVGRAVQAALATVLALWIGGAVSETYQYWAALPAFFVLGETDGETFLKGMQRIIGTVAGAAIGFGLAIVIGTDTPVVLPLLALCMFASQYFRPVSSVLSALWITAFVALLYDLLGRLDTETIELRVVETVIGAGIALVVAAIVLPTRTRTRLSSDTSQLVRTVQNVTGICLAHLRTGSAGVLDRQELARRELALATLVRKVEATAVPLRRSSGALDVRGIEGRLTALWALLFYTRHLVTATERLSPGENVLTESQWGAIQQISDTNFEALLNTLAGKTPSAVQEGLEVDEYDVPYDSTLSRVLRSLERIDQTVTFMVEDVLPSEGRLSRIESSSNRF